MVSARIAHGKRVKTLLVRCVIVAVVVAGGEAGADAGRVREPAGIADVRPVAVRGAAQPEATGDRRAAGTSRVRHRAAAARHPVPALAVGRLRRDRGRRPGRLRGRRPGLRRRQRGRQRQRGHHGRGRVGQQPGGRVRTAPVTAAAVASSAAVPRLGRGGGGGGGGSS